MIKKTTIFIFLLLANMVLLAHSVIPHHHHQQGVCVMQYSCDDKHESYHPSESCQHQNTNCSEACSIDDVFTRNDNDKVIISNEGSHYILIPDTCFPLYFSIQIKELCILPLWQKPYFRSYYSIYISHSLGLRGPPAIC